MLCLSGFELYSRWVPLKTGHLCRLAAKLYIIRLQVLWLTCALCVVASSAFQKTDLLFQNWINNICWINPYLMDTCTLKIRKSKANIIVLSVK